jgi:hypothetical protein
MSANPSVIPLTYKRDLELFLEEIKTSIRSASYGGAGRLDGSPYGLRINYMLKRYTSLTPREKQETSANIEYLKHIQKEFDLATHSRASFPDANSTFPVKIFANYQ